MQKADDEPPDTAESPEKKAPWVTPRVRVLGNVRDLVMGSGKSQSMIDGDPQTPGKRGMG